MHNCRQMDITTIAFATIFYFFFIERRGQYNAMQHKHSSSVAL